MRSVVLDRVGCVCSSAIIAAAVVLAGGCESSGSSLKNLDVVYRFDNVRKSGDFDEWPEVRAVLAKHSNKVSSSVDAVRSAGPVEVRAYKAIVNVPNVRTLDAIQADLEQLATKRRVGGDRIQFTLANLTADYRSNILTAGIESTVGGYASPGYNVLVHPFEGAAPLATRAGTDGKWSQRLTTLPQTRWVYAAVKDPSGKLPDKHYRINISTQQQEAMDPKEYARLFPPGQPGTPIAATPRASVSTPSEPRQLAAAGEALDPVRARSAEDERIRLQREREEESRRKRRELEERIDQRLRDFDRRQSGK